MKKFFVLCAVFVMFFAVSDAVEAQRRTRQVVEEGDTRGVRSARAGRARSADVVDTKASPSRRGTRSRGPVGQARVSATRFVDADGTAVIIKDEDTFVADEKAPEKTYAVDLAKLNTASDSIKQCQSKILECANTFISSSDSGKTVGLGLCHLSPKKYGFGKKEEALKKIERQVFKMMGNAGFAKLSPEEQVIYKNLDMQFDQEDDASTAAIEEKDSMTAMLDSMNEQMASIDAIADYTGTENTPKGLFTEVFTSCRGIVETCESVLGEEAMQNYVKTQSDLQCGVYDKKLLEEYRKKTLMLAQVKAKLKDDYITARRKNMLTTEQCFIELQRQSEDSVCGQGMKDCLYCTDLDEDKCAAAMKTKLQAQKKVFVTTLDKCSYGDEAVGNGIWDAFIAKMETKIAEFARMSEFSAKENATKGLNDLIVKHRKEFESCITNLCGNDLLACADTNLITAGFDQLQGAKPISYTVLNTEGVPETKTMNLSEFSFDKLVQATVSFTEANSACRDRIDIAASDFRLLNSNPNVDASLLPWTDITKGLLKPSYDAAESNRVRLQAKLDIATRKSPENTSKIQGLQTQIDQLTKQIKILKQVDAGDQLVSFATSLFDKALAGIQEKADQSLEENRIDLVKSNLEFLAARVEGYEANRAVEVQIYGADKEAGIQMVEKDAEVDVRKQQIEANKAVEATKMAAAQKEADLALEAINAENLRLQEETLRAENDLSLAKLQGAAELKAAQQASCPKIDTIGATEIGAGDDSCQVVKTCDTNLGYNLLGTGSFARCVKKGECPFRVDLEGVDEGAMVETQFGEAKCKVIGKCLPGYVKTGPNGPEQRCVPQKSCSWTYKTPEYVAPDGTEEQIIDGEACQVIKKDGCIGGYTVRGSGKLSECKSDLEAIVDKAVNEASLEVKRTVEVCLHGKDSRMNRFKKHGCKEFQLGTVVDCKDDGAGSKFTNKRLVDKSVVCRIGERDIAVKGATYQITARDLLP